MQFKIDTTVQNNQIQYNKELAKALATTLHEIDKFIYHAAPTRAVDILSWPGVMQGEVDIDEMQQQQLLDFFKQTMEQLKQVRQKEGRALAETVLEKNAKIAEIARELERQASHHIDNYRQKLVDRLQYLQQQVDSERLELEIVLYAQKTDITEEIDRIKTHTDEVAHLLTQQQTCGRQLDFLMQELNREANTIASKSTVIDTTQASVKLKVLIEQMREQIQNIE